MLDMLLDVVLWAFLMAESRLMLELGRYTVRKAPKETDASMYGKIGVRLGGVQLVIGVVVGIVWSVMKLANFIF